MPDDQPADAAPSADDAGSGVPSSASPAPQTRRRRRKHPVLKVIALTVLVLALVTGVAAVYAVRHLQGNITVTHFEKQLTNRPEKKKVEGPKEPLNILVMGIDSRTGEGNRIDGEAGEDASDTTILLHLSADRKRAYGISIPRDTMVDRPECRDENLNTVPGETYSQWNKAFALAGAGCTLQQFEQITGIRVDHSIVVDFNGFQGMVDAIGGVEVCVPEAVDDRAYGITLPAGTYEVTGLQALSYVRERHGVGDGSDIGRMQRQQAFIASMANKVMSAQTLANPKRLYDFLDAATSSLQLDEDLANLWTLAKLGTEFKNIGMDHIKFLTIPWVWDPNDPNRVLFAPEAANIWRLIAADQPLPAAVTEGAITAADPPNKPQSPTAKGPASGPTSQPSEVTEARAAVGLCT